MAALGYLAAVYLSAFFLNAMIIWFMARWLRAERTRFRLALATSGLVWLVHLAFLPLQQGLRSATETAEGAPLAGLMMLGIVAMAASFLSGLWVVKCCVRTTFWRATAIGLVAGLIPLPVMLFVPRVFAEAFTVPSGPMAPTLTNQHLTATCPICGKTLFIPESSHDAGLQIPWEVVGICEQFHRVKLQDLQDAAVSEERSQGDRFLVDKTARPARWELAVFRPPEDPSTLYVKRLVGLPGEKVVIMDDSVWIDGKKLTLPPELQGLTYSGEGMPYASAQCPCQLADDECFMLGDFTDRSSDSRYWGPVKESEIIGVVTVRYWPLSRWKVFR